MTDSDIRYRNSELRELVYTADSSIHGTGLFASRDIEAGEYIGTYWGPEAKRNGTYVLWVYDEDGDDDSATGRCGRNLLRYLNHAKECNAEFDAYDLYAVTHVPRHGEITFDYGSEFLLDE